MAEKAYFVGKFKVLILSTIFCVTLKNVFAILKVMLAFVCSNLSLRNC